MPRTVGTLLLMTVGAVILTGCSEPGEATPTTAEPVTTLSALTTEVTSTAASGGDEPTSGDEPTTTTLVVPAVEFPQYAIVERIDGDAGDTLVVLLDTTSFTTLTDIDLENVIADVFERFPPVFEVHVVDDAAAVPLVLASDVSTEDLDILDEHYLVRLSEGFRILYQGPFSDTPDAILGS